MSGLEIYTKKAKFSWEIACMDIAVTVVCLSAIFGALFSVFSMPYKMSCVYFLQAIAIPLAICVAWGRKYKKIRYVGLAAIGILSYFWLDINALAGARPCVNSAIRLINKCYNIQLLQMRAVGGAAQTEEISFYWILCILECLCAVLLLHILKRGRRRAYVIFVFLLPVLLGILCGKVPDIAEGCFLAAAIFLFLTASYQREQIPVKALLCAAVLLLGVGLSAGSLEAAMYDYKRGHLEEYRDIQWKLIEARTFDISDWIPESLKKLNVGNGGADSDISVNAGMSWNKDLKTLESLLQTGQVVDEVTVSEKPTEPVYWSMFEGYVYTGNGWEEEGTDGIYEDLKKMKEYCSSLEFYGESRIAEALDRYFSRNFRYTKNPGKMPEDKDFVEGFMFEKKQGFCVHFATAATIVYQMCGKEARYVEGYRILPNEFKQQADGTYKARVTDYMAHAWCETYQNTGDWKVREHTISSGLLSENPTATPTQNPSAEPSREPTPSVTVQPSSITPTPSQLPPTTSGNTQNQGPDNPSKWTTILLAIWNVIAIVFSFLWKIGLLFVVLCGAILSQQKLRMKYKNRQLQSKYVKKAVLEIYRAVQELCRFEGLHDREVWRREKICKVAEQFPQISAQEWVWLYDCVERTMFSNDVIGAEEQKEMYEIYRKLRKGILRSLKGARRFWFLYGRVL